MNISASALDSLLNRADVTAGSAGGGLMGLFNRAAQQVQQGAGNAEGAGQGGVSQGVQTAGGLGTEVTPGGAETVQGMGQGLNQDGTEMANFGEEGAVFTPQ